MGINVSRAEATPPPGDGAKTPPPPETPGSLPPIADDELPCPVKYEEMQREAMCTPYSVYQGGAPWSARFDITKPLNQKFALTHSVFMGSVEVPHAQAGQVIKVPGSTYEFGANLIDSKVMLIGRILTDGRMSGRIKYDFNDALSTKLQCQLTNEAHYSQAMLDLDYKGNDCQAQVKLGNNAFYGFNYIQSVTKNLALGGEAFWLGHQRKSGYGLAARHDSDAGHVSTVQVASTGLVSLSYWHKVSEKVALASDFMYNWNTRESTASMGYDYMFRSCRLRGKIDQSGVVSAFLEEKLNVGITFLLSGEIDHVKKDYKFGFGLTVGE